MLVLVLMIMIEISWAAKIEHRTPNTQRRMQKARFGIRCSVFGVRCLRPNLFPLTLATTWLPIYRR